VSLLYRRRGWSCKDARTSWMCSGPFFIKNKKWLFFLFFVFTFTSLPDCPSTVALLHIRASSSLMGPETIPVRDAFCDITTILALRHVQAGRAPNYFNPLIYHLLSPWTRIELMRMFWCDPFKSFRFVTIKTNFQYYQCCTSYHNITYLPLLHYLHYLCLTQYCD